MKTVFYFIFLLIPFHAVAQIGAWTQKASLPAIGRLTAASFSIGSKGYLGLGGNPVDSFNDFWEFDPAANIWSQKATYPGGCGGVVGFSIGGKGYFGTGFTAVPPAIHNDFWAYDPITNAWTQKAPVPGAPRYYGVGFSVGGKGYIGAGAGSNAPGYNDFYAYDTATNSWTQKASIPGGGRTRAVGFSIGATGYVGTGHLNTTGSWTRDFYAYDAAANTWTQKADFGGRGTSGASGFSINNRGYIGTGVDSNSTTNRSDFWEYNPTANAWVQRADFGGGQRYVATAFAIGNRGYMGTGGGSIYYNDLWEYSAALQTGAVTPGSFCTGTGLSVPFTNAGLSFNAANIFTAQLSNATGSFASPVNVGTLTSTAAGTISAVIPANTPAGTGYRIRVISSSPVDTGIDNGTDIIITASLTSAVAVSALQTPACNGQLDTFTATAVNGGLNPSYQWIKNHTAAGNNSPVFSYIPNAGDSVYGILTTDTGCYLPHIDTSNKIAITLAPPDLSTYYATATSFCLGDSIVLNADLVTPGLMYHWQLNGHDIPGASTGTYVAKASGTYNAVLTEGSCTSGTALVTVNAHAPMPVISVSGFTFSTSTYSSYQWYDNGQLIPGATSQSYLNFNTMDSIRVAVTDTSGCRGVSAVAMVRLGVAAVGSNEGFSFYPNPAKDRITLVGNMSSGKAKALLYDMTGREVATLYAGDASALKSGKTVLLPPAAEGIYLLKISLDDRSAGQWRMTIAR